MNLGNDKLENNYLFAQEGEVREKAIKICIFCQIK